MGQNVPNWYVQQYNQNIQALVQQKVSRLRMACTTGNYTGSGGSPVDQIGVYEMQDVGTRFEPMPRIDPPTDRRWIYPIDADLPVMIDKFDKLRLLTDPQSAYVQGNVRAANRKIDDRVLPAFFASAATGVNGGTPTAFGATGISGQVIGVNTGGTASGMNVAKLEAGRNLFVKNEVDLEEETLWVCYTGDEDQDLRNELQIISLDYNEKPVFNDKGLLLSWRGFNFIHSERPAISTNQTDDQSGSSHAVPMWVRSGMHVGIWDDIKTDISQRNDIRGLPWQAYTTLSVNATRLEEKKVAKIWCR